MVNREHIIHEAAKLFVTYGIKSVRMDDIAQELGVSKRTLYEQFGDKENLLYEAMLELYQTKRAHHADISARAENVLDALFQALREMLREAPVNERLTSNLKRFYPKVYEQLKSIGLEDNHRELRQLIEQGIREGLFVDWMNTEMTINIFYGAAYSLKREQPETQLPSQLDERGALLQVVHTLFRGIATAKGLELIDSYRSKYWQER